MRVPTKITPDRIRDSIIKIHYESEIPFLPIIGYFHSHLSSLNYDYIGSSFMRNETDVSIFNHLFVNNDVGIKIHVHPEGSVNFNILDKYIGWDQYSGEVTRVLEKLMSIGIIKSVMRIRIRYTSEFPNIDIIEKVKFDYHYDLNGKKIKSGRFNLEYEEEEMHIALNLVSNVQLAPHLKAQEGFDIDNTLSLIDIDVLSASNSITQIDALTSLLFTTHRKQKETFFSLLKEDFIQELNPEYES